MIRSPAGALMLAASLASLAVARAESRPPGSPLAQAQAARPLAVSLKDGRLTFSAPAGFRQLTPEEVARKFPASRDERFVYANEDSSVSIVVNFAATAVQPAQLEALRAALERSLTASMPGLKVLGRGFPTIEGTRWALLEFTSLARDTPIHNEMLATSFDGRMLAINFNATAEQYRRLAEDLVASRNSIRLRP